MHILAIRCSLLSGFKCGCQRTGSVPGLAYGLVPSFISIEVQQFLPVLMPSRCERPASSSGPSSAPENFLQVTLHRCWETHCIRHLAQVSEPAGLLIRILQLRLCPKAELSNISEFDPVRELFLYAKRNEWCSFQLASTFIVARGVRGREGVQVIEKYVKQVPKVEWESTAFVADFYNVFDSAWRREVLRTRMASALSHQEHLSAGMSGRNFTETLKSPATVERLFGAGGVAVRLSPFFSHPENLNAARVLAFWAQLTREPIALAAGNNDVQNEAARILGKKVRTSAAKRVPTASDNSYNAMDFTRCYSNILTDVFGAPRVTFTPALWNKMLATQRKQAAVKDLLKSFQMTMKKANDLILSRGGPNWTTFWVLLCEVRQAMDRDRKGLEALVAWLEARPHLASKVAAVIKDVVQSGAKHKECYCVRVCSVVRSWMQEASDQP